MIGRTRLCRVMVEFTLDISSRDKSTAILVMVSQPCGPQCSAAARMICRCWWFSFSVLASAKFCISMVPFKPVDSLWDSDILVFGNRTTL
jgi:hypothetical protein